MKDELFDRDFQAARAGLNNGIERGLVRLGGAVVTAFRALHRRQWAAPWRKGAACR